MAGAPVDAGELMRGQNRPLAVIGPAPKQEASEVGVLDIERLQVEGGFLDGFDVSFRSGLNVLIGARGTGKTSVVELVRFALDAASHTPEASARSNEHATAVLGDGVVTVHLADPLETVTVSRSGADQAPRSSGAFDKPLIFSQTEIETLGKSASGRLRLLDGFIAGHTKLVEQETAAIAAIKSIFRELASLQQERDSQAAGLDGMDELRNNIALLEVQETELRAQSGAVAEKQSKLDGANRIVSGAALKSSVLERFQDSSVQWATSLLEMTEEEYGPESWDSSEEDPLIGLRDEYSALVRQAAGLATSFQALADKASTSREAAMGARMRGEEEARGLRAEVDRTISG